MSTRRDIRQMVRGEKNEDSSNNLLLSGLDEISSTIYNCNNKDLYFIELIFLFIRFAA